MAEEETIQNLEDLLMVISPIAFQETPTRRNLPIKRSGTPGVSTLAPHKKQIVHYPEPSTSKAEGKKRLVELFDPPNQIAEEPTPQQVEPNENYDVEMMDRPIPINDDTFAMMNFSNSVGKSTGEQPTIRDAFNLLGPYKRQMDEKCQFAAKKIMGQSNFIKKIRNIQESINEGTIPGNGFDKKTTTLLLSMTVEERRVLLTKFHSTTITNLERKIEEIRQFKENMGIEVARLFTDIATDRPREIFLNNPVFAILSNANIIRKIFELVTASYVDKWYAIQTLKTAKRDAAKITAANKKTEKAAANAVEIVPTVANLTDLVKKCLNKSKQSISGKGRRAPLRKGPDQSKPNPKPKQKQKATTKPKSQKNGNSNKGKKEQKGNGKRLNGKRA